MRMLQLVHRHSDLPNGWSGYELPLNSCLEVESGSRPALLITRKSSALSTPSFIFANFLYVCFCCNGLNICCSYTADLRWIRVNILGGNDSKLVLLHLLWFTHSSPRHQLLLTYFRSTLAAKRSFFFIPFSVSFGKKESIAKNIWLVLASQLFLYQANSNASYLLQWAGNGQRVVMESIFTEVGANVNKKFCAWL